MSITPIDISESKPTKTYAPPAQKLCLRCGRKHKASEFYTNRDWSEQAGIDIWCKDCVHRCVTKDEMKEYFWYNHRAWSDKMWKQAEQKAERLLAGNAAYASTTDARRRVMLSRLAAQQVPTLMQGVYYQYEDTSKDGYLTYEEAKSNGAVKLDETDEEKIYSDEFNGYFSKKDLAYLENYYTKLEEDFNFDNESLRDYARKVCKASLQADKAQDDFASGKCSLADVKDAMAQFDMLSKSANFAACKRNAREGSGLTSWSETTYKLETTGHTMQRKIEWPQDDVDRVLAAYSHVVASLGLDTI